MLEHDTIAAIATAPGMGAVALLRVSGAQALECVGRCWSGRRPLADLRPRLAYLGAIQDAAGVAVDQVLLTIFRGPASYTGEDVVEIACHGGVLVTRKVLEALLAAGARCAEPGEFTQRAFLNGKMDLTQAEAVMDLISAQTNLALRAAGDQLQGRLGREIRLMRQELLEILAHVEAYIDFPEEDIAPETGAVLLGKIAAVQQRADQLLSTADQGRILREGVRTVLCGPPNAGKSSLLNLLLGFDRAIVSATAGTTRDTIEEVINLRGFPLRLVDTAGVRQTEDSVEQAGVSRSMQQIERADLILEIADASQSSAHRIEITADATVPRLLILNKSDLPQHPDWQSATADGAVALSCQTGDGVGELTERIAAILGRGVVQADGGMIAINARHQSCLQKASAALAEGRRQLASGVSAEFVSLDLRLAMDAIGEVIGKMDTEELLGEIFSRFCIGK